MQSFSNITHSVREAPFIIIPSWNFSHFIANYIGKWGIYDCRCTIV